MTAMRLGVHLPVAGKGASPSIILQVAAEAERIGLDSVWSWERLMRPTVPIALGGAGGPVMDAPEAFGIVYDPIETLAYVAAQTSRITLGTSVLDALFQSPIILARRLATLDRLSDGRLVVRVGQGWMEQEFRAAGVSMKRRGAGFEEHILAMRDVWSPDPVSFEGRFYRIPEADRGYRLQPDRMGHTPRARQPPRPPQNGQHRSPQHGRSAGHRLRRPGHRGRSPRSDRSGAHHRHEGPGGGRDRDRAGRDPL